MNTTKFFHLARNASQYSDFDNAISRHLGCVIVYKNRIISVGWNCDKQHPLQKKYNKERGFNTTNCKNSLHAEIHALIKCQGVDVDWSKTTVFVYREFANGKTALARPCRACMKAIIDRGIKHICYTTDTGYIREVVY
jgi:deoxycytidylate deaminase